MKIAIGFDHAGFALKETVLQVLHAGQHTVLDCGTFDTKRTDFPLYAFRAAQKVAAGEADRAILVCGSGAGMCIAANKVRGIRASVCHDTYSARQAVEHDRMNILCLGARVIGASLAEEVITAFLQARVTGDNTHHAKRLAQITAYENEHLK